MSIFKSLFSHRKGITPVTDIVLRDDITSEVINAIRSCYYVFCETLLKNSRNSYAMHNLTQEDIEKELWWRYMNMPLEEFNQYGKYHLTFVPYLQDGRYLWYQKLDILEYVVRWAKGMAKVKNDKRVEAICDQFIHMLNIEFERLDYGYRLVNDRITDITSDEEKTCIEQAVNKSKDNIREHLNKAIEHYSAKPAPDIRNSIKESITAVEAVCRELTREETLGKALKKLEDNGIVIQSQLKSGLEKLYVYTNQPDTGIRHALMDTDGKYVPTKDEAYFMLVSCSVFINYLRMKVAKKI